MDNGQVLYGESTYLVNIIASNGKELEPVYLSGGDSESQFASILSSKGQISRQNGHMRLRCQWKIRKGSSCE